MKKQQEDFGLELQRSYDRWNYLYKHGGSDPFWEDGGNLNLVRNHICYYREKIKESMPEENYPAVFFQDIPPEVDSKYMARPDEIRAAARVSLSRYKADPNFQYILEHREDFTPRTRDKLCIDAVIGYATGLEHFIKEDSLLEMRRHEHSEHYLESFERLVRTMKNTPPETVQCSMFSFLDGFQSESETDEGENEDYYDDWNDEFADSENDDYAEM